MLFDLRPKDSLDDLFGRDEEVAKIQGLIQRGRWIAVLGPRMVGKTSIAKVACSSLRKYRYAYVNLWGSRDSHGFLECMVHGINSSRGLFARGKDFFQHLDEFSVGVDGLSVKRSKHPMNTIWDLMSAIGNIKDNVVLVLDEIQEIYRIYGLVLRLLANVFNTYKNLMFVFTGSMVGLMKSLLEPPSTSPLYGRAPAKIYVDRFTEEESMEFLRRGFEEQRLTLGMKGAREVTEQLDGTPGWLTLYGSYATAEKLPHDQALKETIREASKIVRDELNHFLEGRDKDAHVRVLKAIAYGANSWSAIKKGLEASRGLPVNDKTLKSIIDSLLDSMYVAKRDDLYAIPDPLVRTTARNIRV